MNNLHNNLHKLEIFRQHKKQLINDLNNILNFRQHKKQLINDLNNILQYIDNIYAHKFNEFNKNIYKINAIINDNKNNNNENNNEINNENNNEINNENNNEINNENNSEENLEEDENLAKFMKEFLDEHIITLDDKKYIIINGQRRRIIENNEEKLQLMLLMLKAHSIGHEGLAKTYERLKPTCYWRGMVMDIRRLIKNCTTCQLRKKNELPEPTEKYATKVEAPFTHWGLDIIGPLNVTQKGNQYIFVIVDYFTKWVEAEPSISITANDVVQFLIKVFARFGTPSVITTDNGVQFTADYTKIFLDLYDVYIRFIVSYHPESNGLTENRNREINKYLRILANNEKEWDVMLPMALWALRTSKNSITKYSSYELVFGRKDMQPFELAVTLPTSNVQGSKE
eukprot:jgi/Orpsp1_1/1185819/evm.model.c7180000095484.1